MLGEQGTPRLAKYPLWHPHVSWDFNISTKVPALTDLTLAPSNYPLPIAGPSTHIFVATPLIQYVINVQNIMRISQNDWELLNM